MMSGRLFTLILMSALAAPGCAPSDDGDSGAERPAAERPAAEPPVADIDMTPTVVIETTKGRIVVELNRERAPESVDNFLRYVSGGFYDDLSFHRVQPHVIQTGRYTADRRRRSASNAFPVINEADNGLKNVRGSIAMARRADPHSATNQFFINVLDNPGYDFKEKTASGWGYAVFGHVTEGLDVLDAIVAVPTRIQGAFPAPIDPIVIERAYVADRGGN